MAINEKIKEGVITREEIFITDKVFLKKTLLFIYHQ
jgi:diketogulonate reductase-like aldo/keto reductase